MKLQQKYIFSMILVISLLFGMKPVHAIDPKFTIDKTTLVFKNASPSLEFYDVERGDQYNYFLFQVANVFEVNQTGSYIDPRIVHLAGTSEFSYHLWENTTETLKTSFDADIKFWTKNFHINNSISAEKTTIDNSMLSQYVKEGYYVSSTLINYNLRWSNWDFANYSNGLNVTFKFYSSAFTTMSGYGYGSTPLHFVLEKTDSIAILKATDYISNGSQRPVSFDDIAVPNDGSYFATDSQAMWYDFTIHFPAQTTEMGLNFELYLINNQEIDTSVNRPSPFPFIYGIVGIFALINLKVYKKKK